MPSYSPKFPLSFSSEGGYSSNTSIKEVVKQNFKNLVLTAPGERIANPNFGVGLYSFLFEQNDQIAQKNIRNRIERQIETYMPFIELQEFVPEINENHLYVRIKYFIIPLGESDILSINTLER